jgi:hypothetical protein
MDWKTISSFLGLVAVLMGASYYFWDLDHKVALVEDKLAIVQADLDNFKRLNQGPPGEKGERGPTGPRGEKGDRGENGPAGDPTDLVAIRKLIDEEIKKDEYLEKVKEQIVKIINEDAGVQTIYKDIISKKPLEIDLKESEAKVVFGNQLSVGLESAYSSYSVIRVSTDIENQRAAIYPGDVWVLKGTIGKFGIALISTKSNGPCKFNVYKIESKQSK